MSVEWKVRRLTDLTYPISAPEMGCSSKSKSANTERGTEKDFFISKCVIFEKYDTRAITGRITKKALNV